jgi:hypothetical protein
MKVSQSLMKSLYAYSQETKCGTQIYAQYFDNVKFPSSPAMELGNYLEYICTGSLSRDGSTPVAETTKKGEPTSKYKIVNEQKNNFDKILNKYGFKVLSIDHHFKSKKYSGIADIIAEKDGVKCIIDVKSTGLIDDKWSDFGWHDDFVYKNDNLMIQAKHYKMLALEEFDIYNIPFYFFVFSTTNSTDCKVFQVDCSHETLEAHKYNSEGAIEMLNKTLEQGFKSYPNHKECSKCPIKETCNDFIDVPIIKSIKL